MDDMERYSDYNDTEDDIKDGKKSPVGIILKAVIFVVVFGVIALFAYRMIIFNSYPDELENIYFNEELSAYYEATDGDIGALTQKLRAPYDDNKSATFLADNLVIIEGVSQVQCSLRYNLAIIEDINEKYSLSLTEEDTDAFTFVLTRNHETDDKAFVQVGTLDTASHEFYAMYGGYRLVFDGVDLLRGEEGEIKWLALEIYVKGADMDEPYRICIYENHDEYSKLEPYELSKKEHP